MSGFFYNPLKNLAMESIFKLNRPLFSRTFFITILIYNNVTAIWKVSSYLTPIFFTL